MVSVPLLAPPTIKELSTVSVEPVLSERLLALAPPVPICTCPKAWRLPLLPKMLSTPPLSMDKFWDSAMKLLITGLGELVLMIASTPEFGTPLVQFAATPHCTFKPFQVLCASALRGAMDRSANEISAEVARSR